MTRTALRLRLTTAAVLVTATASGFSSCKSPPPRAAKPGTVQLEDCRRLAIFPDELTLRDGLPHLYREHTRDLIVIETTVYLNPCSRRHLGGASEKSRVEGAEEQATKVQDEGENSRHDDAGEESRVDDRGEESRNADEAERNRDDDLGEKSRVDDTGEKSRADDVGEDSRVEDTGESSRLADMGENSRVADIGEASRVGGSSSSCRCRRAKGARGYTLIGIPRGRRVRIYDGVELRPLVQTEVTP